MQQKINYILHKYQKLPTDNYFLLITKIIIYYR